MPTPKGAAAPVGAQIPLQRGQIPFKNQLELYQVSYVQAVIAAAGCTILSANYDDGTDLMIKHRSDQHKGGPDAYLEIQLKCTSQVERNPASGVVPVKLSNDRFNLYAVGDPTIKKIVVAMIAPPDVQNWIRAGHNLMAIRHCCYWVNIAGKSPTGRDSTVVNVPTGKRFDDVALCEIMMRIGQGGVP